MAAIRGSEVSRSRGLLSRVAVSAGAGLLLSIWSVTGLHAQTHPDLNSPDPGTRVQGVFAVRSSGDTSALPRLAELVLSDAHKGVRLFATMALGELGTVDHVPVLEQVGANDPAPEVRQAAQQAIQTIRSRPVAVAPVYVQPAPPTYVPPATAGTPTYAPGTPAYGYVEPAAPGYVAPADPGYAAQPAYGQPVQDPTYGQYGQPQQDPAYGQPVQTPVYGQPAEDPSYGQPAQYAPGAEYGLPETHHGDRGTLELAGFVTLSLDSNDDMVTQNEKDLVANTTTTRARIDVLGGYYLLDRLALLGLLGLDVEKTSFSRELLTADLKSVETEETSRAENNLTLALGAGYLFPFSDTLSLEVGLLGGLRYCMAQLETLDQSGLGFQGRGMLALRYALHPRVHLLTNLQGVYNSRRLTVEPLAEGAKSFDQDQSGFSIDLGLGLATWF